MQLTKIKKDRVVSGWSEARIGKGRIAFSGKFIDSVGGLASGDQFQIGTPAGEEHPEYLYFIKETTPDPENFTLRKGTAWAIACTPVVRHLGLQPGTRHAVEKVADKKQTIFRIKIR